MYDISVSLDTSIITEINAKLNINEVYSEANTVINNFNTMFTDSNIAPLKLSSTLQELQKILNGLINANSTFPFTSHIKNAYCEVVFLYKELAALNRKQ